MKKMAPEKSHWFNSIFSPLLENKFQKEPLSVFIGKLTLNWSCPTYSTLCKDYQQFLRTWYLKKTKKILSTFAAVETKLNLKVCQNLVVEKKDRCTIDVRKFEEIRSLVAIDRGYKTIDSLSVDEILSEVVPDITASNLPYNKENAKYISFLKMFDLRDIITQLEQQGNLHNQKYEKFYNDLVAYSDDFIRVEKNLEKELSAIIGEVKKEINL